MKVFVWDEVLWDYTPGMMFAVAENIESARARIQASGETFLQEDLDKEPKVYEIEDQPFRVLWGGG